MYGVVVRRAKKPIECGEIISMENTDHDVSPYGKRSAAIGGLLRTWLVGRKRHSPDTAAPTGRQGHEITGWSFPWSSARTEISEFCGKPLTWISGSHAISPAGWETGQVVLRKAIAARFLHIHE
jgi:hypothetical protein